MVYAVDKKQDIYQVFIIYIYCLHLLIGNFPAVEKYESKPYIQKEAGKNQPLNCYHIIKHTSMSASSTGRST